MWSFPNCSRGLGKEAQKGGLDGQFDREICVKAIEGQVFEELGFNTCPNPKSIVDIPSIKNNKKIKSNKDPSLL